MKLFLTLICAFMVTNAVAMIAPVGRSSGLKYDGTVDASQTEKHFINVQNKSGATIAANKFVIWDLTADNGVGVTVSSTLGASPACVMVNSCASNAICKCQKYGYFATASLDGTGSVPAVAGQRFYLSSTEPGAIAARVTPLATEVAGGIFYDAGSSSAAMEIFINL